MLYYYRIWGYHKLPNIELFCLKVFKIIQEVNESKYNFAFVVRFNLKFLIREVYFLKGEYNVGMIEKEEISNLLVVLLCLG